VVVIGVRERRLTSLRGRVDFPPLLRDDFADR
jgi:hypothetical protein